MNLQAKVCFYKGHWTNHIYIGSAYGHVDLQFIDGSTCTVSRLPERNGWLDRPTHAPILQSVPVTLELAKVIQALIDYQSGLAFSTAYKHNCIRFVSQAIYGDERYSTMQELLQSLGQVENHQKPWYCFFSPIIKPVLTACMMLTELFSLP